MYCDYKISQIINGESRTKVSVDIYLGDYVEVTDSQGSVVEEYRRNTLALTDNYDLSGTPTEEELTVLLNYSLQLYAKRHDLTPIPEQSNA